MGDPAYVIGTQTHCEECEQESKHTVRDSRPVGKHPYQSTRRRKECPLCGHRYTTYEVSSVRMDEMHQLEEYRKVFGSVRTAEEISLLIKHMRNLIQPEGLEGV